MSRKARRQKQRKAQRRRVLAQGLVIAAAVVGLGGIGIATLFNNEPESLASLDLSATESDPGSVTDERSASELPSRGRLEPGHQTISAYSQAAGTEGGLDVVRAPVAVSLELPGQGTQQVVTDAGTVRELLLQHDIVLGADDIVSPGLDEALAEGTTVRVLQGETTTVIEAQEIPFTKEEKDDASLVKGTKKVVQEGKLGEKKVTYRVVVIDGKEEQKQVLSEMIVAQPVAEVTAVGTKVAPTVSAAGSSGRAVPAGGGTVDPGSARAIAKDMLADRGWGDDQFACLDALWHRESGWRHTATNPSSGAYGIPQSLPGSKMAAAGADWRTNPATQITWGLGYISDRYTTPCGAWSAFQSRSPSWY